MRSLLLASTCFVALASPAAAETTISTTVTGPIRTSTVKTGGLPDDILINSTGIVNGNAGGGVIIDSNHKLNNQGTIQIGNVSNVAAVDVGNGLTTGITLSGKIVVDEPHTPTDADNDGDLDGPFALGSNRYGIRTNGAMTGNILITSTGTITIEGNDSFGIRLGGPLTGNFSTDGKISVLGSNTVGVQLADVSGSVRLAGEISAQGQGAIAVRSTGNVGGAMTLQGKIAATGYRYTSAPADPSKLDADDLLQGGPAVSIEGNVANGIIVAVPPKDNSTTDNDEDDDGIEDSKEGSGQILSYGSAAALRIGSAGAITIGATQNTATGFGLIIDGIVAGSGVYTGVDGNGLQIGGMGGTVSIANGIGISGTVQAQSLDKVATAIKLGAGTTTPELRNSGKVLAGSGKTAGSIAVGVDIDVGANLPILRNSGTIGATLTGGTDGTAIAIIDRSGTLNLIENSGTISATGAAATSNRNVAIDLSANTTGATVKQTAVAANFTPPSITGDIRFGTGSDTLDVADGKLAGNVSFGTGANKFLLSGDAIAAGNLSFGGGVDEISTSGTSKFNGAVDFGGGADVLNIKDTSAFTGQLTNATGLAVNVQKGTFGVVKTASIASLNVTDGGIIAVTLDKTPGEGSSLLVSGTASFGTGSKLLLGIDNVADAEGNHIVISAGTLTGGANLTANSDFLPFLYKGTLSVTGNQVAVNIARKSTGELGLNRSESAAFNAIYEALANDDDIGDQFLAIRAQGEFVDTLRQMLPDHAGGAFETVTMGDRTAARLIHDTQPPYERGNGEVDFWLSQVVWGSSKGIGDTAGFKTGGAGLTGGAQIRTPLGDVGASINWLVNKDDDKGSDNRVDLDQLSITAHWRAQLAGFQLLARAGYGFVSFDSERKFFADATGSAVERTMDAKWDGNLVTASAYASREWWAGSLFIRPSVGVEYYRLSEDGYEEEGGGEALDLTVEKRTSDEVAATGLFALGYEWGASRRDEGYFRLELEAGRRQVVGGSLGDTTARFEDGDPFTLEPEERDSSWVARVRGIGGSQGLRFSGEVGTEEREKKLGLSARASLVLGL